MADPVQKPAPQPAAPAVAAASNGPKLVKVKKGELIFGEGDSSRAMYLVKQGSIRIFKKKGEGAIELDTIHSGAVFGELAFLDGLPRSASCEALSDSDVVEISGATFTETISKMPDWVKILLKTVVGRLRAASNKIRLLEASQASLSYTSKDGRKTVAYTFISLPELLKASTSILLVASRNGKKTETGIELNQEILNKYSAQVFGIAVAKITAFLDILTQCQIVTTTKNKDDSSNYFLMDIDFLEKLVFYFNDENLVEPSKRKEVSLKGFVILSYLIKHLDVFPKNEKTGTYTVNVMEIKRLEKEASGKDPFRLDEFDELARLSYCSIAQMKGTEVVNTEVNKAEILLIHRIQKVMKLIEAMNEQKRKTAR